MSAYQIITVTPLRRGFGANVSGVDLSGALDGPTQAEIRQAWVAHSVLCFPGQTLDPASLERFSAILGPFGHAPYVTAMEGFAHVIEVRREARETTPVFGGAWHSDWSFQATPPSATVLYGVDIPPVGGATVLADAARAYADLSPTMQRLLSSLRGVHSAAPAYGPHGLFARDDDSRSMRISVSPTADNVEVHPIVRRHPQSGCLALYVNHVYTIAIEGLRADESKALLEFLFSHMTRTEYVYRHHWQPQTLLVWDNRCVVHYAEGGYAGHRRLLYRTTVAGERPLAG